MRSEPGAERGLGPAGESLSLDLHLLMCSVRMVIGFVGIDERL